MNKHTLHYLFWIFLILTLATGPTEAGRIFDHPEQESWPELVFDKAIEFNQANIIGSALAENGQTVYRIQYWTGNVWRNIETDYSSQNGNFQKFHPVVSQKIRLAPTGNGQSSTEPTFTVHNETRGIEESGFVLPDRNSRLPDVLLLGDSITQQYTPYVEFNLKGVANVYRLPPRHDWDSKNFIPAMKQLKQLLNPGFEWDVIHFNFGLHDMKRYNQNGKKDREKGTPQVGSNAYASNLQNGLDWISEIYPHTKLIFATTTPVPEGEPRRRSADSAHYNTIARQVLSNNPEVAINDLYGYTLPNQAKWQIKPGNVHFNETGQRAQGKLVADTIQTSLNQ